MQRLIREHPQMGTFGYGWIVEIENFSPDAPSMRFLAPSKRDAESLCEAFAALRVNRQTFENPNSQHFERSQ